VGNRLGDVRLETFEVQADAHCLSSGQMHCLTSIQNAYFASGLVKTNPPPLSPPPSPCAARQVRGPIPGLGGQAVVGVEAALASVALREKERCA
jgi:hypothetical protein